MPMESPLTVRYFKSHIITNITNISTFHALDTNISFGWKLCHISQFLKIIIPTFFEDKKGIMCYRLPSVHLSAGRPAGRPVAYTLQLNLHY